MAFVVKRTEDDKRSQQWKRWVEGSENTARGEVATVAQLPGTEPNYFDNPPSSRHFQVMSLPLKWDVDVSVRDGSGVTFILFISLGFS